MAEPKVVLSLQSLTRIGTLVTLTLQNTALVLLTKFSYRETAVPYAASTVVASAEFVKLVVSFTLLLMSDGKASVVEAFQEVPSNAVRLMLPSVLYVVQNNLLFEGMRLLSPTMYMVCSQSKILTSAFCSVVILHTTITRKQYGALLLLVSGIVTVQSAEDNRIMKSVRPHRMFASGTMRGIVVVFMASLTSGLAGTYLEKMYKERVSPRHTIWFRNVQLACFSLPIAILSAVRCDSGRLHKEGIFQGYDAIVISIIALHAAGGLVVAAVLRYANNVLKCFAVSISICNCSIATIYLSDTIDKSVNARVLLGVALVIMSTFLFQR